MIAGKESARPGEAKNSWLTGTAAWTFFNVSQYLLGVKPQYDGLMIDPCIPGDRKGFTVDRKWRGGTYHIQVENPNGVQKGVVSVTVDGKKLDVNVIPDCGEGCHDVQVVMG